MSRQLPFLDMLCLTPRPSSRPVHSLCWYCQPMSLLSRFLVSSDRGGHYRWPGRVGICGERGVVRSISGKGRSPGSSRMEGFFGRPKAGSFCGRDWRGATMGEPVGMLGGRMGRHRGERRKSDLGYPGPAQYRRSLGLAA